MARFSATEFDEFVSILASAHGLAKLQEKLTRLNALVSRRRIGSVEALSRQLYQLTVGLERDGVPRRVLLALWEEFLGSKIDEPASKRLEELADRINASLTPRLELDPSREEELRKALREYREALAALVGEVPARLTMLNRAVPDVARVLREG